MTTLTIIPIDKTIIVDGELLVFEFDIDEDIHAMQWNGSTGHIEYKSGKENKIINDISDYQSYINLHGEEKVKQEQVRLKAEQDELEKTPLYIRERTAEYGSLGEQLDMIYWDKKNETAVWETHIDNIKIKYPKL